MILTAAADAFDASGYLATRLDHVVDRTDMTKGAVYFHFASKEGLAEELIERHYLRLEGILATSIDQEGDALGQLVLVTLAFARAWEEDVMLRAGARLAAERELINPKLADPYDWWFGQLIGFARRARRADALADDVAPATVARTVTTFLFGAMHLASTLERRNDLYRRVSEFWQLLEPSLRA